MANEEINKSNPVDDVRQFFVDNSKGEQIQLESEFRGLHLKGRTGAELICDCCGDGDDCCGFN